MSLTAGGQAGGRAGRQLAWAFIHPLVCPPLQPCLLLELK